MKKIFLVLLCLAALYGVSEAARFALDEESWKIYTLKETQAAIEAGADINAKNDDGATPLMLAAGYSGDPEIIRALIGAGANVNEAAREPNPSPDEAPGDIEGMTPLMWAAEFNGNPEILAALIQGGADVNAKDDRDREALWYAVQGVNNPDVLSVLIEAGADIDAKDYEGSTPLTWAAVAGNTEAVNILIQAGADINAKGDDDGTPLISAAWHSEYPEIIRALIRAGADVNAKYDYDGGTPLIYAARNGNLEILNILIQAGADVGAKDDEGKTALDHAREKGHNEAQIFLDAASKNSTKSIRIKNDEGSIGNREEVGK